VSEHIRGKWLRGERRVERLWHDSPPMWRYCDMLPNNASVISGFWIYYPDLLDKSSGGISINYNTLNLTVITLR
jgi:hypothetical protein